MAEESEPKAEKKAKKTAVPDVVPEPAASTPTAHEIREAKKAQLTAWAGEFGLKAEGTVDELRKRLLAFIAKKEKSEAAEEKAVPPEKPPEPPTKKTKVEPKPKAKEKKKEREKPKGRKGKKPSEKEAAEEEKEEEEAEEPHEARQKPKLEPRIKVLLALRAAKAAARPKFRRQEWFRYRKFGDEWRKPQGGQSKLRRHFGYRWNLPSIGYRGPREVRGLHPSGFLEVLVHNPLQLDGLDPGKQAVRIAHGVGARKRELIEKACDDKGLRVLNRMVTD
ncbi:MAG TPA: 50S ribosomal protein L32e [Thermoplasmata archaeon]|nr:50S ribosomal protein L32e [Thermoplasmata archaeon]